MAENELIISFKPVWVKRIGDCSKCAFCEENIYGEMYSLLVKMSTGDYIESEIAICSPCFDNSED